MLPSKTLQELALKHNVQILEFIHDEQEVLGDAKDVKAFIDEVLALEMASLKIAPSRILMTSPTLKKVWGE